MYSILSFIYQLTNRVGVEIKLDIATLLRNLKSGTDDVGLYQVAEDMATTELTTDSTTLRYTGEVSKSHATEGAAEADPSWEEDINFDEHGVNTIVSIYAELHWSMKRTAGITSSAKMQISGDGGVTWVDMTDDVIETGTVHVDKTRAGVGRLVTSIAAGTNKLKLRLCAWSADATSVETKIREDTFLRVSFKKS